MVAQGGRGQWAVVTESGDSLAMVRDTFGAARAVARHMGRGNRHIIGINLEGEPGRPHVGVAFVNTNGDTVVESFRMIDAQSLRPLNRAIHRHFMNDLRFQL